MDMNMVLSGIRSKSMINAYNLSTPSFAHAFSSNFFFFLNKKKKNMHTSILPIDDQCDQSNSQTVACLAVHS